MATNLSRTDEISAGDLMVIWKTADGDYRGCPIGDAIEYIQEHLTDALCTTIEASSYSKVTGVSVANLPAVATAGEGARAVVTDATAALTAGIGTVVAGGGANVVPVFCDGTNWRIG